MLELKRHPLHLFVSATFTGGFLRAGFCRGIFEVEDESTLVELKIPLPLFGLARLTGGFSDVVFGH